MRAGSTADKLGAVIQKLVDEDLAAAQRFLAAPREAATTGKRQPVVDILTKFGVLSASSAEAAHPHPSTMRPTHLAESWAKVGEFIQFGIDEADKLLEHNGDGHGLGIQPVTGGSRSLSAEIRDALEALPECRRREMTAILSTTAVPYPHRTPSRAMKSFRRAPPARSWIWQCASRRTTSRCASVPSASEIGYRNLTLTAATLVVLAMIVGAVALGLVDHERCAMALGAASGLTPVAGAFPKGRDPFPARGCRASPW